MAMQEYFSVGDVISVQGNENKWRVTAVEDKCVHLVKITPTFPPMTATITE